MRFVQWKVAFAASIICVGCAAPDVQFETTTAALGDTTTVYEIDGLMCLTEFWESSVSDFPVGAGGAETRDEAVADWVDNESLLPDPESLTLTEDSSGKVIFVDDAGQAQIILDIRDDGNGWLVHGYRSCTPADYSPSG